MAFLHSITTRYEEALGDIAARSLAAAGGRGDGMNAVRLFLVERLIALAAGAVFVVAPACIVLSGAHLPGTYGAAAAIALTFAAIPFLALGWLNISAAPWIAAILAFACWAALVGSLVTVSPMLALTGGVVLFQVAVGRRAAEGMRELTRVATPEIGAAEARDDTQARVTRLELTAEGIVENVDGPRESVFRTRRLFIDHVHLADRIALLEAFSGVANHGRQVPEFAIRVNLASPGNPQAFEPVQIAMRARGRGAVLELRETAGISGQDSGRPESGSATEKRFLATMSHELRTPLNSIIGFSDILRRDLFGALANDRQREYVELIHSSGIHLLSVVNTILDVSKINAGTYSIHRELFDLNYAAGECVAMLKPQAEQKGLAVELDAAAEITQADGDRRAIKQIMINLLSNAVKFSQRGGVVRLTTERRERGFLIRVSDTGIGMSEEELKHVGTPFMQADNSYTRNCEGTGLGLAVVRGLVQLHGGSLDVESKPGEGTRVSIYIPASVAIAGPRLGTAGQVEDEFEGKRSIEQGDHQLKVSGNAVRLAG